MEEMTKVSVPCRGILFFNVEFEEIEKLNNGFRPLSGNLIFQCNGEHQKRNRRQRVRPLSGNLIFQRNTPRYIYLKHREVSVPCRGILFFNTVIALLRFTMTGFRPLSGNLIFQLFFTVCSLCFFRFRPLSGNLIFQF